MKFSDFAKGKTKLNTPYIFVDYDDTVRQSVTVVSSLGSKSTSAPDQVKNLKVFKDASAGLKLLKAKGYQLIGISNQNGPIRKKQFSKDQNNKSIEEIKLCAELFRQTNKLLGINIPVVFSSDNHFCYVDMNKEDIIEMTNTKKPNTPMVDYITKRFGEIDKMNSFVIGDDYNNTDSGLASKLGIDYVDPGKKAEGIKAFAEKVKFRDTLEEGLHDKYIFKAIFLAGSPGSGKSYVEGKLFSNFMLKKVNVDIMFEYLMKKLKLNHKWNDDVPPNEMMLKDKLFAKSRQHTDKLFKFYTDGKLPIVIDGTGKEYFKVEATKSELEEKGYDTYMIFVDVPLEVALERNSKRDRSLSVSFVTNTYKAVSGNKDKYIRLFGEENIFIFNNALKNKNDLSTLFLMAWKRVRGWLNTPSKNPKYVEILKKSTNVSKKNLEKS